jgi:hypothetical protein
MFCHYQEIRQVRLLPRVLEMRATTRAIALLASIFVPSNSMYAADALSAAEEYMLRSAVIIACHPVQDVGDLAYLGQGEAIGRAAFELLWAQLDSVDPANHVENGRKADQMMKVRAVEMDRNAQNQIKEKGCAELERLTRPC